MSCARRQCRRAARGPALHCRCGAEFCSEACFIPEWYAVHQHSCPHADAIRAEVATRQAGAARGCGALLVATALSRTRPVGAPTPAAAADRDGGAVPKRSASKKQAYTLRDFESVGPPLGGGSYGKVTKVVHKKTSEVFAMKVVPKQKVVEHQMEDYLAREVKTQLRLQHPNILRLLYYFEDAEEVHLLLEFASGGSLFSVLKRNGRLPEQDAARYFTDVSMALDHLHNKGVVHRDLKPENILMCEGDVAKLADFGWCAELVKGGAPRRTFCGTWDYLSPEMVNNEPHDHSVDIWAMGVLCFEMLTSRSPFAAANQVKALMRITNVDLQIPDYVSPLAIDLLRKLLVKDPLERLPLVKSVEHPWVRQFVPSVPERLAESAAKNAAAVERAAAAALEAEASSSPLDSTQGPSAEDEPAALSPEGEPVTGSPERQPALEERALQRATSEDASPVTATQGGSTSSIPISEAEPSVPEQPAVSSSAPCAADPSVQAGPSLSTMPWERPPQDEKIMDPSTPRTQVMTSSSLSSLTQSQAMLEIPARPEPPSDLPSATAALLQALRDPTSPRCLPSGGTSPGAAGKEPLPDATANFLGALHSGSIAGRLQGALVVPLRPTEDEVVDSSLSPCSHASSCAQGSQSSCLERSAKKVALRGVRDKLAQRRAQLELERGALEAEQLELERRELELSQGHQARAVMYNKSAPGSASNSPRKAHLAHMQLGGGLYCSTDTASSHESSVSMSSPKAKALRNVSMELGSPRRTGSSEGTETSSYAELRSWVRRRTDGLRKDHSQQGLRTLADIVCAEDAEGESVSPKAQWSAHGGAGDPHLASGIHHSGVGSDYAKFPKQTKWASDDMDSTMSSISSSMSKDSRSRPRMGWMVPSS